MKGLGDQEKINITKKFVVHNQGSDYEQKYYENEINNNGNAYNQNFRENKRDTSALGLSKI